MRARLGFATMVHVDADLLLFDEVLAVGDAGFQERCATTFRRLRDSGRTGVLVTHSMDALEQHCDRALLLEGGRVLAYGEPRDVAREVRIPARPSAHRAPRDRERGAGVSDVSTRPLAGGNDGSPAEWLPPAGPKSLRPIEGPSAFGGGWRRFLDLLRLTSAQQYRLQYRNSILGHLWAILRPLTLFGVLYFVFTQVLRFGQGIEEYALMLLLGIMLFQFFVDATGTALGALVRNEPIVRKMHFPRIVVPLSVVVSSGMTAVINLLVTLGFVVVFGQGVLWTWLLVPVVFVALGILTTGVALLLSTLFVRIRDVGQIWAVFARALFYASPILYPLERVPAAVPGDRRSQPARPDPHPGADLGAAPGCARGRRDGGVAGPDRLRGDRHRSLRGGFLAVRAPGAPRRRAALADSAPRERQLQGVLERGLTDGRRETPPDVGRPGRRESGRELRVAE